MDHINELISKKLPQHSAGNQLTTGQQGKLSDRDVVIVDRFYAMLNQIYTHKWASVFADDEAVMQSKKVWGPQITKHTPAHLKAILDRVMETGVPEWPDMSKILNTNTSASPNGINAAAYKPYKAPIRPTATALQKAEKKARGMQSLAVIRKNLGMEPVSEASRGSIEELDAMFEAGLQS